VIPRRRDQLGRRGRPPRLDESAYRRRNAIERCVGWLKGDRAVGTRHDKLAASYLAFVKLAMLQRLLRALRGFRDTT
jgi:transposase